MAVKDKIDETERYLKRIKENQKNEDDLRDHFSSFLTTARSILDFLLSDFADKYGLDIKLETRDLWTEFRKKAKEKNNSEAVEFHKFFIKKYDELIKDNIAKEMLKNRKLNIHRVLTPPFPATYVKLPKVDNQIHALRIETINQKQSKEVHEQISEFLSQIPQPMRPSINKKPIYVLKNSNYELIQSCDHYFLLLQKFVSEIKEWTKQ